LYNYLHCTLPRSYNVVTVIDYWHANVVCLSVGLAKRTADKQHILQPKCMDRRKCPIGTVEHGYRPTLYIPHIDHHPFKLPLLNLRRWCRLANKLATYREHEQSNCRNFHVIPDNAVSAVRSAYSQQQLGYLSECVLTRASSDFSAAVNVLECCVQQWCSG